MSSKTYLRYYQHKIFPEFSGISYFDGKNWVVVEKKYTKEKLQAWRTKYPDAEVLNVPLPDPKFAS